MDQKLFADCFSNHFLKHAVSSQPLLLMLDGHSSHYTLELIRCAAENEVIIFCLPPHTTADRTRVVLVHSRLTGQRHAISLCLQTLVELCQNSNFPSFFHKPGQKGCLLTISLPLFELRNISIQS